MKKILVVLVVVALAMVAVGTAHAAISTTKHNMASSNTVTGSLKGNINEICIYCHTPHGGAQADGQPLWNRYAATVSGFSAYTSLTMSAPSGANGASNPASSLCFSCHDGSTSINSLRNVNGSPGSGTPTPLPGLYAIGSDNLTNDHPIGMIIPTKTGYNNAPATMGAFLVAGKVECSTCHAVHGTPTNIPNLLRMDNTGSLMCLDCHTK